MPEYWECLEKEGGASMPCPQTLCPAILQTSNDVRKIYDIVYDVVYDIVYDVTRFIQPAARLLHQPTLLPRDCASKLQLLSALILERAPAASLLHP